MTLRRCFGRKNRFIFNQSSGQTASKNCSGASTCSIPKLAKLAAADHYVESSGPFYETSLAGASIYDRYQPGQCLGGGVAQCCFAGETIVNQRGLVGADCTGGD